MAGQDTSWLCDTEDMTIKRLDHVSVVVDDLAAAVAFFKALGMSLEGEMPLEGPWVDRINGLEGVQVDIVMMRTPDGHGRLELTRFRHPKLVEIEPATAPPNTLGLRSVMLQSRASMTLSLACAPTAPNSSARWPSTRTSTDSATCEALRASSSRWPRNSPEAFTAFGETGDSSPPQCWPPVTEAREGRAGGVIVRPCRAMTHRGTGLSLPAGAGTKEWFRDLLGRPQPRRFADSPD
jgi:hypothetical protein